METRQSNAAKAREASVHKWQVDLPMARKASGLEVGVVFRPDNCKQFTRLGNRIKLHYETRLQVCKNQSLSAHDCYPYVWIGPTACV